MSNIPYLNVTDGGREEDPVLDYRFCLFTIGTFFSCGKGTFREHQHLRDKWLQLEGHTRAYANAHKHYHNVSIFNRPLTTSQSKNYCKFNSGINGMRRMRMLQLKSYTDCTITALKGNRTAKQYMNEKEWESHMKMQKGPSENFI